MNTGIWGYAESSGHVPGEALIGYAVEATDGGIGKVDRHTEDVDRSYLVVDTGPWILGHKVVLPAGLVDRVDQENETVHLNCTRKHVRESPDFEAGQDEHDVTFIRLVEQYYSNRHM
ncbi:PRC-barrel domain containing protein [Streptomyces sp. NPDC035033]|uniref:PRC-barrel domain containing protein n=1 Tax=Streptomyces sp. NPDC035033 TaxID=3155368 RepID=UPI00340B9E23